MEAPRPPRPDELDDLEELTALCFHYRAARAREPRRAQRRRRSFPREARIIVRDGKPVSHIRLAYNYLNLYGCSVKIASIGGVCTHPAYRGQGLASQLLEHCIGESTRAGAKILLISGARGLYHRAGAVPCGPVWEAELRAEALQARADSVSVRPVEPDDWFALASLYQAENVRFVRSADYVSAVLQGHHRQVWLMESLGRAEAYLSLSRLWGRPRDEPVRLLGEYAGARSALMAGLPALFQAAQLERIQFSLPAHDHELIGLFRQLRVELRPGTLHEHTVRLLNLPGLMRSLRPYVAARLPRAQARHLAFGQEGERCTLSFGGEQVALGLRQAGALVLGRPKARPVPRELGNVLSSLFPLPFPLPGFNYV